MFRVLGKKGYGYPMHGAVLADLPRCLHVRKRKYPSPSDSGNYRRAGADAVDPGRSPAHKSGVLQDHNLQCEVHSWRIPKRIRTLTIILSQAGEIEQDRKVWKKLNLADA